MVSVLLFIYFIFLFSYEEINFVFCVLFLVFYYRFIIVIWFCFFFVLAGDCEILLRDSKIECLKLIFIWIFSVDFLYIFDRK